MKKFCDNLVISVLLAFFISSAAFANYNNDNDLFLAINESTDPSDTLHINIPNNYHTTQEKLESFYLGQSRVLEYIPHNQSFDTWTEILTAFYKRDTKLTAARLNEDFYHEFTMQNHNTTMLYRDDSKLGNILVSDLALHYPDANSHQIVYMRYYFGDFNIAGVQYAKKIPNTVNIAHARKMAQDMQSMLDDMLTLTSIKIERELIQN